ncbi:MAG: alpha/beta hydrolase [Puniceicoccaceae bacterium]|nr:MAG: alpha/beta hydrolase [Puniceicoccaceae bacterium]
MSSSPHTLIIHGWSDCSASFQDLKKRLLHHRIGKVDTILYADYESREDSITYNDIADGLQRRLIEHGMIDAAGRCKKPFQAIIHSTGGLVIRHWLWRYYGQEGFDPARCPLKRLIMLAPANFGSPLAHRGKSFLGSLFKGRWKVGDFLEVGRGLLEGLELGSPYQWQLAHRDLLVDVPWFQADGVQLTILTGIDDYTGLRGWINKPGTDGTIVIAGASVDSVKLRLDFSQPSGDWDNAPPLAWQTINPPEEFGFGVLPDLDHGSIVSAFGRRQPGLVEEVVLRALRTRGAAEFRDFTAELEGLTAATYLETGKPVFQQFIVHAVDDHGADINDFTIECTVFRISKTREGLVPRESVSRAEAHYSQRVGRAFLAEGHTHTVNPSYRRFLAEPAAVTAALKEAEAELGPVALALHIGVPAVDRGIYYDTRKLRNIVIWSSDLGRSAQRSPDFFFPNTTTLVELVVDRRTDYVTLGPKPRPQRGRF